MSLHFTLRTFHYNFIIPSDVIIPINYINVVVVIIIVVLYCIIKCNEQRSCDFARLIVIFIFIMINIRTTLVEYLIAMFLH